MKISLKLKEEVVEVEDMLGVNSTYIIRELTGEQRDRYLNYTNSKMRLDNEGNPLGIKDVSGLYEELLALSLTDPMGNKISTKVISQWPSSAQSALFKKAQELSGLGTYENKKVE